MDISIENITVKEDRKRPIDTSKVAQIAHSITELGLLNPITVRPVNEHYELVAGAHRLEAFKLLQRTTIPVKLFYGGDLEAELAEIDENLIRNDLTVLQQGENLKRRNEILEEMDKRAKSGGQPCNDNAVKNEGDILSPSFFEVLVTEQPQEKKTTAEIAEEVGLSKRGAQQRQQIAKNLLPEVKELIKDHPISDVLTHLLELCRLKGEEQVRVATMIVSGEAKDVKEAKKLIKKAKRKEEIEAQQEEIANGAPNLTAGVYEIIAIDPPWPYETKYDPDGRRASNPYPEMSLDEIKAIQLPVAEDCILWLWTTHKFMRHSFEILDSWGFRDVSILTWVKDRMGLGQWLRSQTEFCIMAVKGKPLIDLTNQTTVVTGPLREHSRKPDEFYQMVDGLCPGRKLDYFSRQPRQGWDQYGNDKEHFNELAG